MSKPSKVKATCNIWGNWLCHIGSRKDAVYADEFDAREWLLERLAEGCILSDKSEIRQAALDQHRDHIDRCVRR